jgi:hypothetical protein|tara:strand:+ start:4550 stop:4750 length:201 start_codon:yes stop_codon:yes gene_type:complete
MASITKLTPRDVAAIKARLRRGEYQHRIAADYDLNQGRISEIATGKRFPDTASEMVLPFEREAHHG